MQAESQLTFDRYTVDLPNAQLLRGGQRIALTRKAFAVLRYLLEHTGQVVTKAELFEALWPGTVVSDGALTFCIVELRKALGDNAKAPRFIETVHGRGYRFIGTVVSSQEEESQKSKSKSQKLKIEDYLPAPRPQHPAPTVVGRETDLVQLHLCLTKALSGERQIGFVTGEPGIGKTTLVETFLFGVRSRKEFGVQSHEKFGVYTAPPQTPNSELSSTARMWVAVGRCVEHYGPGEPYMPILEALGRLCRQPGSEQLVTLLTQHAPTWLVQMPALLKPEQLAVLQRNTQHATQERMLREMGEAIEAITAERPLVLWLEDLHWSDSSTLELLSVLARRHEPARLLVIGTYRPVDVIVQDHPLRAVKQELQLHGLCEELPLGLLSEAQVAEYLEARFNSQPLHPVPLPRGEREPQAAELLPKLAQTIHHRTDGNPLFMVTLVDDLLSQGVLAGVDGQRAVAGEWATIETRVPATIQQLLTQQLERLSTEDRRILEVASVAEMEFSAASVAAGLATEVEIVEERCEVLAQHGRFLRASGTADWPDGTVATQYSFLHALYQDVLYGRIAAGRRQRLHQHIGERQEAAYGKRAREIATALAVHFEHGRDYSKAVQYLRHAAQNALRRSAYQEAIRHCTKGLEILKLLPDTSERSEEELPLQLALSDALSSVKGFAAPEVEAALTRARNLCQQREGAPQLVPILSRLVLFSMIRGEIQTGRELAEQLLHLAHRFQDRLLLSGAHGALAIALFFRGELLLARSHFDQAMALYDLQTPPPTPLVTVDPRINYLAYAALTLWHLGYADQALQKSQEAVTLAAGLSHPFSLAFTRGMTALFHELRREERLAREYADAAIALSIEHGFPHYVSVGQLVQGWALTQQGQMKKGLAQMQNGLVTSQNGGAVLGLTEALAKLAEAYGKEEQNEEGLSVLAEAFVHMEKRGERFYEAELYRLKGELSLQSRQVKTSQDKSEDTNPWPLAPDPQGEAEACFLRAIAIAQKQQAKSLELRATVSLARLWQQQGKHTEAHRMLSEIYNWFTEGFDTKDLQEAKALLESLGQRAKWVNGEKENR